LDYATLQQPSNGWWTTSSGWKSMKDDVKSTWMTFSLLLINLKCYASELCVYFNDLYLKPEKCEFEKQEVNYRGFIIKLNKIAMDPKKLTGIFDWPSPKNLRQVRSFLGFEYFYRQFIQWFSHIVKPLMNLTKKGEAFNWTLACEDTFQKLKQMIPRRPCSNNGQPD
jgi:hypothetical protein